METPYLCYFICVWVPRAAMPSSTAAAAAAASDRTKNRQPAASSQWLAPATDHHECLSGVGENVMRSPAGARITDGDTAKAIMQHAARKKHMYTNQL